MIESFLASAHVVLRAESGNKGKRATDGQEGITDKHETFPEPFMDV